MFDDKIMSKMIRMNKKKLRPDMDDAGQEAPSPEVALAEELNDKVSDMTGEDHAPATDAEMGENESSQDTAKLKKVMARIAKYIDSL